MSRLTRVLGVCCAVAMTLAAPARGVHDGAFKNRMNLVFQAPNETQAVNSDLAFWGDRAYAGNYDSFRTLDISDPDDPRLVTGFRCPDRRTTCR